MDYLRRELDGLVQECQQIQDRRQRVQALDLCQFFATRLDVAEMFPDRVARAVRKT